MAKVLYITANPKKVEDSFSLSIGQEFLEEYKKSNTQDEIVEIDVYKENIPLIDSDVFNGWGKFERNDELTETEMKKVSRINEVVEQFIEADKYIFVTPMWNLSIPAMMKAYIDNIVIAGKTFKYTEQGPVGLLEGKKGVHIQARGGFYSEGPGADFELGDRYIRTIIGFLGVADFQSVIMEGHAYDPNKADEIKARAIDKAISVAKEF